MRKNKIKTLLLALLLITANIAPLYAKEAPKILVNKWALNEINDARIEGIIKSDNISQSMDFTKEISPSQLNELIVNTENKLNTYNLTKNEKYKSIKYNVNDISKNNVTKIIYNISKEYDKEANNKDKIIYLKENKVLNGNGKTINLNKKVSYEEAAALFKRTVNNIINKQNMASKGMFYKAENNGNTVYLFGSIHIGNERMYPINDKVMNAFNSANELYVEVNLLKDTKDNIERKHSDGKSLKDDLGNDIYSKYKAFMDKYNVKESIYKDFKPWVAYNFLSNMPIYLKIPNASSYGVDVYFLNYASRNNKVIKELESSEMQLNMLADFDSDEYIKMTDALINNLNNSPQAIDIVSKSYKNLINIWILGDSDSLNRSIVKSDKFTNNLFDKRDIGMTDKIESMLKSTDKKTYFVVAGSAHFTPDDSVIKILQNRGYKIEKIK